MRSFLVIVAALCLLSVSCKQSKKESEIVVIPSIGKYLYVTDNGIIHCDRYCFKLRHANEQEILGMHFIDTLEFASDSGLLYCTRCFDDEEYEQVQKIIRRNTIIIWEPDPDDDFEGWKVYDPNEDEWLQK